MSIDNFGDIFDADKRKKFYRTYKTPLITILLTFFLLCGCAIFSALIFNYGNEMENNNIIVMNITVKYISDKHIIDTNGNKWFLVNDIYEILPIEVGSNITIKWYDYSQKSFKIKHVYVIAIEGKEIC